MKKKLLFGLIAVFCLALAAAAFAEDREDGQAKSEPQLRKEMVKLKYVRADDAKQLLLVYKSMPTSTTLMGATVQAARDANQNEIIIISDLPEVVDKMLSLIKEIDIRPLVHYFGFYIQIIHDGFDAG